MKSDQNISGANPKGFFGRNLKRARNVARWAASGQFTKLGHALLDQVKIRSAPVRRLIRKSLFQKQRQKMLLKKLLATYYGVSPADKPKGTRIALILRDGTFYPKSSAFIRLVSPLTHKSLRNKVSIKIYGENTTAVASGTDVCIVQRTAYDSEEAADRLISHVEQGGMSLIVDSDDAFHGIDETHPEHASHTKRIKALDHIARAADQIWLSVPALIPSFPAAKGKAVVVKNGLDTRIWDHYHAPRAAQHNNHPIRMVYMGTATHDADLKIILPALDKVAKTYPGSFVLTVIGVAEELPDRPWITRAYQPRNGSIYPVFVRWFRSQGPFDVGLSPLVDSQFNRGKSDIKCLDYLAAGIRPVVSNILPYQAADIHKFIIKADNRKADWEEALSNIVSNPAGFREQNAKLMPKAQDYIWHKRSCAETGEQMLTLIKKARSAKKPR